MDYETWLRRDEEIARDRKHYERRELLGEYYDIETGCTPEEMEANPELSQKEAGLSYGKGHLPTQRPRAHGSKVCGR